VAGYADVALFSAVKDPDTEVDGLDEL